MTSERKRYAREELLSFKEISASIHFEIARIPVRVLRRNHKKSTSTDHEGSKSHPKLLPNSSQEDLAVEEVDPSSTSTASWHRMNRYQWHSTSGGNSNQFGGPCHSRQRCPSGPHGDDETATGNCTTTTTSAPLRPAPDTRRGGHGDWSRGCAGWRQRSYSGSERSFTVPSNVNNANTSGYSRGVGRGGSVVNTNDSALSGFTSRGRGRARGRYNNSGILFQQPRGMGVAAAPAFSKLHGASNTPMSCSGSVPTAGATTITTHISRPGESSEDFWQDEDWENAEQQEAHHAKPQQIHTTEAKMEAQGSPVDELGKAVSGMRIHSKSCSVDPPPGFTLPNMFVPLSNDNQAPEDQLSSTFLPLEPTSVLGQPCTSSSMKWYYIDLEGRTQGPFSNHQMAGWMANGLLPLNIEIRRDFDQCFLSLVDHMHLAGRVPFWDGYTRPAVTHATVASLSTLSGPRWSTLLTSVSQPPVSPVISSSRCMNSPIANKGPTMVTDEANSQIVTCDSAGDVTGLQTAMQLSPTATGISKPQQSAIASSTDAASTRGNALEPTYYVEGLPLASYHQEVDGQRRFALNRPVEHSGTEYLSPVPVQGVIESVQSSVVTTPIQEEKIDEPEEEDEEDGDGADLSVQSQVRKVEVESTNTVIAGGHGEVGPKLKKRKKSKKSKPNANQERLCAWEAEFERRKAAARERQLAEEAELEALAAEEAAAAAEEQSRLASEQARILNEQRRREAQRVRADSQLSQLQLPMSAKWGGGGDATTPALVGTAASSGPTALAGRFSNSLLVIQAAQASEEAERKRQESLLADQEAAALTAVAASTLKQRPAAWSAVVQTETRPPSNVTNSALVGRQPHHNVNSKSNRVAPNTTCLKPSTTTVTSAVVDSPLGKAERSKPTGTVGATHTKPVDINTSAKSMTSPTASTSIWDLPAGGAVTRGGLTISKNSKKNKKKNTQCSREAVCFAAREELAHWCEAQLSSLPLPSVDLPTLVDLLCELEATDQVVEFIETSLGRSKQISKFSKAFLEKRACMLKAVP